MAAIVGVVGLLLAAGSSYMSYESNKEQEEAQEEEAERQAAIAAERAEREARIMQEQMEYDAKLAAEQAAWETEISLEAAEYTRARIAEEAAIVQAAQKVGYGASGIDTTSGSPLVVMSKTARIAESEREQVMRGHEIFAEARAKEARTVAEGGEYTYAWFMERLHAETGYEVESRQAEASMYRSQAKYSEYGTYFSTGSSLLGGAANMYAN